MTYSIFFSTKTLEEFLAAIATVAAITSLLWPRPVRRIIQDAESRFSRFAMKRPQAITAAIVFPLALRLILLPVFPIPQPRVHDEFSHLLLGDTLAHGRLSNPSPPYWQHFETEYELIRPTYASQYEPGQGVALATGEVLAGNAWWGVWLSVGLMCGALCWALGFATTPRWALFGALMAALQFGVFGFWMNSYFGGAVPAIGGALVFGSILRRPAVSSGVLAGLGVAIVLASRPVEGLIWLGAAVVLLLRRRVPKHMLLATAAVVGAAIALLGYYNARVTGDVFRSPYAAYRQDYGTPQSYWWQPAAIVSHFDHAELAANYADQLRYWERRYSAHALWESTWHRLRDFWRFFIGPFLTPAMIFAVLAFRRKRLRAWIWVSAIFVADHATYHAWYPQQSASETILIVMFLVEGSRRLRMWRPQRGTGLAVSRGLALGFGMAMVLLCVGLGVARTATAQSKGARRIWESMISQPDGRTLAVRKLNSIPGRHLVFVRYGPEHAWYDEWVFNSADIPGSRIVFARMCSPESDKALADVMNDRDVWIATPGERAVLARVSRDELLVSTR